jgi:hypothetical protein
MKFSNVKAQDYGRYDDDDDVDEDNDDGYPISY